MDVIIKTCCGIDVHKTMITACIRVMKENGKAESTVKTFQTMTKDLLELSDWLKANGVTHIAMESTGVYWKPLWNILEGNFELLLVNAKHIKQLPGRKTDIKDCEWIAQLLQHGLLPNSFVPDRKMRELRDLTRYRIKLIQEKAATANRIQKVFEDANIKLASVATDVLGTSGRLMINKIIDGEEDPKTLANEAKRKLRDKLPELEEALRGKVTNHHRFMLKILMKQLKETESLIEDVSIKIEEYMRPFEQEVSLLIKIPGIKEQNAQNIIAEIGTNMNQYPSDKHLASWAGVCPGNNESAGKRKSGKTPDGNKWLRKALTESAWGATHKKGSYFKAFFQRLVKRRGKYKALVAVGHSLLVVIYHILNNKTQYVELGENFFIDMDQEKYTRYYKKKLEEMGFNVEIAKVG